MVVPLRPGKFYGSSLPRPRIYTDVKFSDERVDPPLPVLAPLMDWANQAHWSMGGLSLNRPRLQGRIEGNVEKLRKERERTFKKKIQTGTPIKKNAGYRADSMSPPPAVPVPKKRRQRWKWVDEEEMEDAEEEEIEVEMKRKGGMRKKRRLVRKLGDDFDSVASKNGKSPLKGMSNGGDSEEGGVAMRTRSRRAVVMMEEEEEEEADGGEKRSDANKDGKVVNTNDKKKKNESGSPNGSRSSPRLNNRLN